MAAVFLVILIFSVIVGAQSRRKRNSTGGNTPGVFDYYLLVLSWAPDYCAQPNANRNSRECGTGNHVGFVVHGLWPQFENGGYPDACAPASPVAADIVTRMLPYIPDAGLIQHEWRDHGTCSGLSAADYFTNVRKAFDSVQIPADYKTLNHEISVSPGDLEAKFAAANAAFPETAFHVGCGTGQVDDVRICFNKNLSPRVCSTTLHDCTTESLTMLPER